MSRESMEPVITWTFLSIGRSGTTACRGSIVPDAASARRGEKRRKFSGVTSTTRSDRWPSMRSSSRAAYAPPKPPPTMSTSHSSIRRCYAVHMAEQSSQIVNFLPEWDGVSYAANAGHHRVFDAAFLATLPFEGHERVLD